MHSVPHWIIYTIGFTAQLFFAGRTLFQWIDSERKKEVTSPATYWGLSVVAAYLMFLYGVLRDDFAIVLGQFISYYVYLWNLNAKGIWDRLGRFLQALLVLTPIAAVLILLKDASSFARNMFHNDSVPFWLLVFGSAGQIIFTLRFIVQWACSRKRHESVLPRAFWVISLIGSGVIVAYGIFRKDPVLILGQSFGFVSYIRNLMIGFKKSKNSSDNDKTTSPADHVHLHSPVPSAPHVDEGLHS